MILLSVVLTWLWVTPLVGIWQKPVYWQGIPLFFLGICASWLVAIVLIGLLTSARAGRGDAKPDDT